MLGIVLPFWKLVIDIRKSLTIIIILKLMIAFDFYRCLVREDTTPVLKVGLVVEVGNEIAKEDGLKHHPKIVFPNLKLEVIPPDLDGK